MSNVCLSWQEHQTNDVIAQSVLGLGCCKRRKAREHAILWPAHELQTGTDKARRQWRRQLARTSFVQMHVMWLWC